MPYTDPMRTQETLVSEAEGLQLFLPFVAEPPPVGGERPLLSRVLARHPSRRRIVRMVDLALDYFPELEGIPIRIGIARGAQGYASLDEPAIWLNPRGLCYQTIAHELVHLLQARGEVPLGERSCDLYSLARALLLVDAAPVYLEIPAALTGPRGTLRPGASRLIHDTAREAVARRGRGERRYIRWFENQVAAKAESIRARAGPGIV
ncbi:MAG: hypothetical protein GF346_06335 [Candidatus Eisenbacteria bacterium]|nr:hypothetical protein [Candidatus Latescibacterota bacterium]MBD3302044.1 hypothetical protein [Candidatus Eisenbacteria bacterium]